MTRNKNHHDGVTHWSDINHDVLFLVMMQLGVVDFIAFSGVCKSWRSLALTNRKRFMASMPPMSMKISIEANEKDSYCYLKDFKGRRFKTILPHSAGRKCVGITCGYVILFGRETRDFWLVNLITRHELHFPNYPLDVGVYKEGIKAILVFSPSISGWVFVVLHRGRLFYILGKPRWNRVSSTLRTPHVCDLHAFKGKIYTLHKDCSLRELRLDLPNRNHKWTLVEIKNCPKPHLFGEWELVNSSENLYMIHQSLMSLELDFDKMKWVSPEMIGEHAFFMSEVKPFAFVKTESWVGPLTQRMGYGYSIDNDKSRTCVFYYAGMWCFPYDYSNVNLLDA